LLLVNLGRAAITPQRRDDMGLMLSAQRASPSPVLRLLPALFFFSGASSLIFETIFTRLLTYTFGNTAQAVSTVLAAFLGGLALGACLLGRWVDKRPPSLWTYGSLELLVGGYCLFIAHFFGWLTRAYVALYHQLHLGSTGLTVLRFGLGALVILPPTLLMGGTFPALARYVSAGREDFAPVVDRLYGWNTLGAALGTLASTFLLMPELGVIWTIRTACGINFAIFVGAGLLAASSPLPPEEQRIAEADRSPQPADLANHSVAVLLLGSFFSGAVALAYEVIWTHVLAFTVGNTVYAFGVMLFTLLCGLGWGAQIVSRYVRSPRHWAQVLAFSQLGLGAAILLTLPLWSRVPDVFAGGLQRALSLDIVSVSFLLLARVVWRLYTRPRGRSFPVRRMMELALYGVSLATIMTVNSTPIWKYEMTGFVAGELLRFFCAFYLLIVPSLLLGMSFPLLLNLFTHSAVRVGKGVGSIYAANTVGAILGAALTGFFLLPLFGSLAAFRLAATVNLILGVCLGLLLVPLRVRHKLVLGAAGASLALFLWLGQAGWDARRMTRGSYVYFYAGWPMDKILYLNEDVQGGLTSVVQSGPTRTMLSNGKFQGNDTGEIQAQIRFALMPILFTRDFSSALVIGLGTGNTLRSLASLPFRRIDAVELAPQIVDAARKCFQDVNADVFDRDPRVRLSIADGRNFLLLSRQDYDLITIEVTSIWIAGEADLYNKEFYELCRARLGRAGVLQQWVQIHHMRPQDLLVVLNTAAQVFPHLALFLGPEQAVLVASSSPLECDYRQINALSNPRVRQELDVLGLPSLSCLLGEMALYGDSFQKAVAQLPRLSGLPANFASTDFLPYLEYQTPKGNALPYNTAGVNTQFVRGLSPETLPPDLAIRNLPSENERNLLLGYAAEVRGDATGALDYFRRVDGQTGVRAKAEIARIKSAAASLTQ
jgi:spermidine synthase